MVRCHIEKSALCGWVDIKSMGGDMKSVKCMVCMQYKTSYTDDDVTYMGQTNIKGRYYYSASDLMTNQRIYCEK